MAEIITSAGLDDKSFLQDEQRMTGLKDLLIPKGYTVEGPSFNSERGVFELMVSNPKAAETLLFSGPDSKMYSSVKIGRWLIYSNEFQKCVDLKKKISKYDEGPFTVHSNEKDGERFVAQTKD